MPRVVENFGAYELSPKLTGTMDFNLLMTANILPGSTSFKFETVS